MENKDCGRCGKCCEAIWLGFTKKQLIDKFGKDHVDVKYVVENWEEITREEFDKINPFFTTQYENKKPLKGYFYKCISFDKQKRLCKDYKNRPTVCSGFPFYPNSPHNKIIEGERKLVDSYSLYSESCVFQKATTTKEEWNKEYQLTKDSVS